VQAMQNYQKNIFLNNQIEKILKSVEEKELNEQFQYLGLVSRDELQSINNSADLLLVCRLNSTFGNYGFPWKLGEYCMTSKPIIATRVGDIERYFKNNLNIYIAEPEDPISIYNKMKLVFEDYQKVLRISKNGYENACKKFNYKLETKKVIDFVYQNRNKLSVIVF
jgi:glycosyltransferase involved in cell wall biosynthesis